MWPINYEFNIKNVIILFYCSLLSKMGVLSEFMRRWWAGGCVCVGGGGSEDVLVLECFRRNTFSANALSASRQRHSMVSVDGPEITTSTSTIY